MAAPCAAGVRLAVRVAPRAAADRVRGTIVDAGGQRRVKVAVTAVPEAGKANAALVRLLARLLKVPKSTLSVLQGASDRNKIVLVEGDPAELTRRIADALARQG